MEKGIPISIFYIYFFVTCVSESFNHKFHENLRWVNDELIITKKKIAELNIDHKDLNNTKKKKKEIIGEI